MTNRRNTARAARFAVMLAGLALACQDVVPPMEPELLPELAPKADAAPALAATQPRFADALQDAMVRLAPGLGPTTAQEVMPGLSEAADRLAAGHAEEALIALARAEEALASQTGEEHDPDRDAVRLAIFVARAGLELDLPDL
jgi:hypothetical protein